MNEIDLKGATPPPAGHDLATHEVGGVAVLKVGLVFCGDIQGGIE